MHSSSEKMPCSKAFRLAIASPSDRLKTSSVPGSLKVQRFPAPASSSTETKHRSIRRFAISILVGGAVDANQERTKPVTRSTPPASKCLHLLCGGIYGKADAGKNCQTRARPLRTGPCRSIIRSKVPLPVTAPSCNESERTINVTRNNFADLDNLGTIINDVSLLLYAIVPILEFPFCSEVEDTDASLSDRRKSLEVGSL